MKHILIMIILAFGFCSCNSFLKEYSQDLARVENVSDLDELLIGDAYYPAMYIEKSSSWYAPADGYFPLNHCVHFMADELKQNEETAEGDVGSFDKFFGYYTWQAQVGSNEKLTSVGQEDADWKQTYEFINVTNMILAELDEVEARDADEEKDKIRIEGEARFLRALYYFSLVNLYAEPYVPGKAETTPGVPLKTTSFIEDKEWERTSVAEVYRQIVDDLVRAAECLEKSDFKSLYRADINAANLLLSRVFLYMQDYPNAKKYAQLVIERKPGLQDLRGYEGVENVVNSQNPEVLFSMGGDFLTYYVYGYDYDKYKEEYLFYVSDDLIEAYDDNDLRKEIYIQEGEDDQYYYKKIYWGRAHAGSPCSVSDNYLFRTSEAYLNLAEAAAFDNDESKAREVLGQLQAKRFSEVPAVNESGEALIKLIQAERQRELCLEGHRWYDIRRYTVLPEGKGKWDKTITHKWTQFDYDTPERIRVFELPPDDKAFTLAFPKEVLDFQNTLGNNHRIDRKPVKDSEIDED